jgi:hypothetical protein
MQEPARTPAAGDSAFSARAFSSDFQWIAAVDGGRNGANLASLPMPPKTLAFFGRRGLMIALCVSNHDQFSKQRVSIGDRLRVSEMREGRALSGLGCLRIQRAHSAR